MTPLAKRIVKELTLKPSRRTVVDNCGLFDSMEDVHCFECSAVVHAAADLAKDIAKKSSTEAVREKLGFLPAPKTWLEYVDPVGATRVGVLLIEEKDGTASGLIACQNDNGIATFKSIISLRLKGSEQNQLTVTIGDMSERAKLEKKLAEAVAALALPFLAMINTPRIIGRTQHMPNRSLERRLTSSFGVGKFPLRAWTEIRLEVTPPRVYDGEPVEAHLTGERAYHFCRQHLRIRLGMLELVSAHWRGDPALGIKQSRYVLAMGRG